MTWYGLLEIKKEKEGQGLDPVGILEPCPLPAQLLQDKYNVTFVSCYFICNCIRFLAFGVMHLQHFELPNL